MLCKICYEKHSVAATIDSVLCNLTQEGSSCHACKRDDCYRSSIYCARHELNVLPMHGTRPCGFTNFRSSCYLNAAIQAIFATPSLRLVLSRLWENLSAQQRRILLSPTPDWEPPVEEALAALLWQSYTHNSNAPLYPMRFLNQFHTNSQDDSAGFLMQIIGGGATNCCPHLFELLQFQIDRMRVCDCGYRSYKAPEVKNCLELPLVKAGGEVMDNVQQVLDYYVASLNEVIDYRDTCTSCHIERLRFMFVNEVTYFPPVLMLNLVRSSGAEVDITCPIFVSLELKFLTMLYRLQSVVNHLGTSINYGHYVTVARHPTSQQEWWFYDDEKSRPAQPAEINSMACVCGWGPMHSYVLFYELRN